MNILILVDVDDFFELDHIIRLAHLITVSGNLLLIQFLVTQDQSKIGFSGTYFFMEHLHRYFKFVFLLYYKKIIDNNNNIVTRVTLEELFFGPTLMRSILIEYINLYLINVK